MPRHGNAPQQVRPPNTDQSAGGRPTKPRGAGQMRKWLTRHDFAGARSEVERAVHRTPLLSFGTLGDAIGATTHLKCENLQKTGSFKVRGALHAIANLRDSERRRGVISVSAGNHAQAVAWAAGRHGIDSVIVMPERASRAKVDATKSYGARVVQFGTSADAFRLAAKVARDERLVQLHPFDDSRIIAGHGSAVLEVAEDTTGDVAVVVPVGGGGLIAGTAGALAANNLLASQGGRMRVYGVEPEGACVMHRSLEAGSPVSLDRVESLADGLAPPMAGALTYQYVRAYAEDIVLVSDAEILSAVRLLLLRAKLAVEPSGAAAVAAVMHGRIPVTHGMQVVAFLTGGNMDDSVIVQALSDGVPWP